jgi:hypothetical protein
MSKRTLRDYIYEGFFARDKASVAKIVLDAEEAAAAAGPEHDEPDGDEGKQAIVIHNHHNEGGNGTGDADPDKNGDDDDDWKKKTDDTLKELRDAVKAITDKLTGRDEFPPKKDDDEDDKDETKDEELADPPGEGAATSSDPPSAEPDLMEADPALKTGKSMMGDATLVARVNSAMNSVIRDTKARAEVLAPGIKIGVLDGALGPDRMKQAGQRICDTRRSALLTAAGTERGMVAIGRHTSDAIKTMSCDAVRMLFIDASDRMRSMNNAANIPSPQFGQQQRATNDSLRAKIEDINKRNAERWAAWGGTARRAS